MPAPSVRTQGQIPLGVNSSTHTSTVPGGERSRHGTTTHTPVHNKGAPKAPRDADGYTFTPDTLQKVENLSKLKFSVDINVFRARNTEAETVTHYSTLQDAMGADVNSQEVLIYSTKQKMQVVLQKLNRHIKEKVSFKACCAIPVCYLHSLRHELSYWTYIHHQKGQLHSSQTLA